LAETIAARSIQCARQSGDSRVAWDLFNGRCGDALFLAAVYARTRDEECRRASLQAIDALRRHIRDPQYLATLIDRIGPGLTGVGSIAYAFLRIGIFLDSPELQREARRIAHALDVRAIRAGRHYSVMWGAAGAILGLLALADAGDEASLTLATASGDHLLAARIPDPASGLLAWPSDHVHGGINEPIGGFAHGTGGIAHALFQLYKRAYDRRYYDAAIEGWSCERQWLERGGANPHARDPGTAENLRGSWCAGWAGVGFSRLGAVSFLDPGDRGEIETDLRMAIDTTSTTMRWPMDTICCGRAGRIDFLLECGRQLENAALTKAGYAMAEPMVAVWMGPIAGQPRNSVRADGGMWQGFAGLGYTLLRLADPGTFPSILVLA
jgi:lantibiotic modifying enzyme